MTLKPTKEDYRLIHDALLGQGGGGMLSGFSRAGVGSHMRPIVSRANRDLGLLYGGVSAQGVDGVSLSQAAQHLASAHTVAAACRAVADGSRKAKPSLFAEAARIKNAVEKAADDETSPYHVSAMEMDDGEDDRESVVASARAIKRRASGLPADEGQNDMASRRARRRMI